MVWYGITWFAAILTVNVTENLYGATPREIRPILIHSRSNTRKSHSNRMAFKRLRKRDKERLKQGRRLRGTSGDGPLLNLKWGDGPCLRPPTFTALRGSNCYYISRQSTLQ